MLKLFFWKVKEVGLVEALKRGLMLLLWSASQSRRLPVYNNLMHSVGYKYVEKFDIQKIRSDIEQFRFKPLISIVMPVYNVDPKWLELAVESVRKQFYENWELCITDDCSTNQPTVGYLKTLDNPKIKINFLKENLGISGASNVCISMATGDYIGLLDNDDELTRDALYEIVKKINETGAEFVYSDEDLITSFGKHYSPHYKSDYNPDLLLCHNYMTHFSVIKKSIVNGVGGFDRKYDGAQDYDLILKSTEKANRVEHVRKVLYHWRTLASSTSVNPGAKQRYADKAGKDALSAAINRRGIDGVVTYGHAPYYYHVRRKLKGQPLVSIVIPFRDQPVMLERCISTIVSISCYHHFEIIAVNNQSEEETTFNIMQELEQLDPRVKFISYEKPFSFSAINNFAVMGHAKGDHVLLLNNDIEVINADWLKALLEHSQRDEVGAVGGKLYYPQSETIQHAGIIIGMGFPKEKAIAGHWHKKSPKGYHGYFSRAMTVQNLSAVTGACLMVKRALYLKLGGLNETDLKIAYNDIDFCLRLREAGFLNVFTPHCEAYHYESSSRGYEDTPAKIERFDKEISYMLKRHRTILEAGDPYFNPNLPTFTEDVKVKLVKPKH